MRKFVAFLVEDTVTIFLSLLTKFSLIGQDLIRKIKI